MDINEHWVTVSHRYCTRYSDHCVVRYADTHPTIAMTGTQHFTGKVKC